MKNKASKYDKDSSMISCDKSWETESPNGSYVQSPDDSFSSEGKKFKKKPININDSIELMKMHNTDDKYA